MFMVYICVTIYKDFVVKAPLKQNLSAVSRDYLTLSTEKCLQDNKEQATMKVYQASISIILLTFIRLGALEASQEGRTSRFANGDWFAESGEKDPVYADKEITFFSNFGTTLKRNKEKGRLDCDWDHPEKVKHCPPVAASPFFGGGGPPGAPPNDDVNCLRTPNHSLCRDLQSGTENVTKTETSSVVNGNTTDGTVKISINATHNVSETEDAPNSFVAVFPVAFVATEAPTRDDCYGNMFDGRFCASSMPSVTEEPTKEHNVIPSRGKLKKPTPSESGTDSGGAEIPSQGDSNADHGEALVPPGHLDKDNSKVPSLSNKPTASPSDSFKYNRGGAKLPTFALPEPRCEDRVAGTLERQPGSEVCVEASLAVTTVSRTHKTVSFSVKQDFTQSSLTWIATQYVGVNKIASCDTQKDLPAGQSLTYTVACDENSWAFINIYVHDETAKSAAYVPGECSVDLIDGAVGGLY
ncbi:hypothetical protein FisN_9Lu164 [Fistulifera solaris]|uniref:Uncharacterized protein n=1 Tax=Fistulifera solaris TaxID=1519565 RepID=A0A1Z5KL58_FISSO|nr:hypothetical protein FisN_9Lu164 [Fistulifera solaris]|eukprot:GAX26865.1 hypothetical protein FisN_9Lu164 [Fistulifera solaris]